MLQSKQTDTGLTNKGQGNSTPGSITAKLQTRYFVEVEGRMGSATVPLDTALLSSYSLSIVTILLSVKVWVNMMCKLWLGGFDPKVSPSPKGTEASNNKSSVRYMYRYAL